MLKIRRAVLIASAERYVTTAVNFVVLAVIARLLRPEEVGLSVIGMIAFAVIDPLRDWASCYLVQQKKVTREDARTVFTVMLMLSMFFAGALLVLAMPFAAFYQEGRLAQYWHVLAISLLAAPFERPILALLQRDMAFATIAVIKISTALFYSVLLILLAVLGFGFMSFALAMLLTAPLGVALVLYVRPDWWIFRPLMSEWRSVVTFGGYNTAVTLLFKAYEGLPYLVLARVHSFDSVGIFNRAGMVAQLPDRVLLAALTPVALPAFAAEAREGRSLKQPYLRSIEHITGVQWPALGLLALLAYPIVSLVLGQQWLGVAPLVQIMAVAALFSFPLGLAYPVLLAAASIREFLAASIIALPVCAVVVSLAAWLGPKPLAYSAILANALQAYVSLCFIRRHVPFRWRELGSALRKSALVAVCTIIGPATAVGLAGAELSPGAAAVAGIAAVIGWFVGLLLTRHPLLFEIREATAVMANQYFRAA